MDAEEGDRGSEGNSSPQRRQPRPLAFRAYEPVSDASFLNFRHIRTATRRNLVGRLTKDIVETYQNCNPEFKFSEELNPKRYLTSPSIGVLNDGCDNANSDLILTVNYVLTNMNTQRRYVVKELLGHGTFGQVAKCWVSETNSFVAVKIIKNQPAYSQQALVEVSILSTLNQKYDPEDKHHIVRIYDYFFHQRHLCICFELLDTNLYELIKMNQFRGLSLSIVQLFSKQILRGLALLKDAGVIHCDLKPENILLTASFKPMEVKIIDFGSACMENRTVYSYIQSRYYRSPEVLLGYQYTTAIDMWSFGCIVAELFLGLPLFPGASEFDILRRMIQILGQQPPDYLLKEAKNTNRFFKCVGSTRAMDNPEISQSGRSAYRALSFEEYEVRDSKKPSIGKEYFHHKSLEAIVKNYPYKKNLAQDDIDREREARLALLDFLRGLVEFDPAKRWSPFQASKHPFVTGEPFTSPYTPPPETPRVAVAQNFKVDHHPGAGHWFAAGLSPNVSAMNRIPLHNASPFPVGPFPYGNSYGSLGSHGSYTEGIVLGSSYGSYGDGGNMLAYYSPVAPSGMYMHPQADARRRVMHYSHGNGIGMSPGNFAPLPLGTSPSQFTPPSHYGPPSPRGSCHGSPLGKLSASSQFNRRKNWGYSGVPQFHECSSTPHCHGQFPEPSILGNSPLNRHHPSVSASWLQQHGGGQSDGLVHVRNEKMQSSPDPGDWDPNYSDDLLLQEENTEIAAQFAKAVNVGPADSSISSPQAMNRNLNSPLTRQNGPSHSSLQIEVSPNRQGQQHPPRISHGRGAARGGDWNHMKLPLSPSSYSSGGQISPRSGTYNALPWGRRSNYPVTSTPPTSHGRKDYGRIS